MKTPTGDGFDSAQVLDVVTIDHGVYLVRVKSSNGDILESRCGVEEKNLPSGERIQQVTFDSDAFQKAIMLGKIQSREVCQAVVAVHKGIPWSPYPDGKNPNISSG